jgi:alkylhydroperoxidase family enzyme
VLIGAVSVTVAGLTFRAAILAEQATDKDRQSVAEAVIEQQTEANAEIQLQDERSRFAIFAATTVEADALEAQAAELRAAGDDEGADAVENDAVEARQSAEQQDLLVGFAAYTSTDAEGHPTFDVERRRADLERQGVSQNQVDSRQTVAAARDLRQQSQRLVGWIVPLVLAVVLLTLAQISRRQRARLLLAGTAVVVWVAATGVALLGGT